jgi:hypothetical protein
MAAIAGILAAWIGHVWFARLSERPHCGAAPTPAGSS